MTAEVSQLCNAVTRGDKKRVNSLINDGVDVNGVEDVSSLSWFNEVSNRPKGRTPLYLASYYGELQIAKLLIEHGADVNKFAADEATPLYVASTQGHLQMVNLLIEKGADIHIAAKDGTDPLYIATQEGHLAVTKSLLANGGRVNSYASGRTNFTPLCVAAEKGHLEITRFLIENKANVQASTKFNNSPLHIASRCGRKDIAFLLIDNGANINAVNDDNETSLHAAIKRVRYSRDLIEMLLHRGADVEARDKMGFTCWEKAENYGQLEIKELILSSHLSSDVFERSTNNLQDDSDVILKQAPSLLHRGASVEAPDKMGLTCWEEAENYGQLEIKELALSSRRPNGGSARPSNKLQEERAMIFKQAPSTEETAEFDTNNNSDYLLEYLISARRKKAAKVCRKFRATSDFISEIDTKIIKQRDEKRRSLRELRLRYSRKLKEKEEVLRRLESRIGEMDNVTRDLSEEREKDLKEYARNVGRLEGEKSQLNAQIEDMKKERNRELEELERKIQRKLETRRSELLEEGERRICKLESRVREVETVNRALTDKNATIERALEQWSVKYEEDQNISQSHGNVETSVAVKKVITFKGTSGLLEGTAALWNKLGGVSESSRIIINNIWNSGHVTGSVVGDVENINANV